MAKKNIAGIELEALEIDSVSIDEAPLRTIPRHNSFWYKTDVTVTTNHPIPDDEIKDVAEKISEKLALYLATDTRSVYEIGNFTSSIKVAYCEYVLTFKQEENELDPGQYIMQVVWVDDVDDIARITDEGLSADDVKASTEQFTIVNEINGVSLLPSKPKRTVDQVLWEKIRGGAEALSFNSYFDFLEKVFCNTGDIVDDEFRKRMKRIRKDSALPFIDTESYRALKVATEAFVMVKIESDRNDLGGYLETVTDSSGAETDMIPYLAIIRRKLGDVDFKQATFGKTFRKFLKKEKVETNCYGLIVDKLRNPIYLELIWSYWMEESMMVQGMNSICRRFQNIRSSDVRDPLAHLEIGPLRPLNNILWGYVQDEQHRLSVKRRAYEYDHHYGLTLQGKAVAGLRPADTRSKFIQAFHSLLNMTCKFYKQFDDKTIEADAFPLLNALKEVHLILSEGAHNQYGDLPSTARIEMMMQQYILARPEFREFLPTRQMVAYPEPWMDRVATLNTMMGWTPTSVMHFRDLAYFGEQILLSIRFGAWTTTFTRENAANWAIAWRSEIQNYIHSYRAVTGADLSIESGPVDIHQPSMHMMRIVREQSRKSA